MTLYADPTVLYGTNDYLYNGGETPDSLLMIGGRELDYINGTLSITHSIDNRCSVRFAVESDESLNIIDGEYVALRLRKKRAFDGLVTIPTQSFPGPFNRIYSIDATCFDALADRRVIAATFQSMTVADIVRELLQEYLYDDDVAEGQISGGFLVTEALFSYVPLSKALDALAAAANYHWHIDGLRRLNFGPIDLFAAPFDLDEIDGYADSVKVDGGNREYRNRQYIRGGKAETVSRTESWLGDGEQKTFVTGFPIARDPTITVDSVAQTVGVKGIGSEDAQWFWAHGSTEVTQRSGDTPLSAAQVLEITYVGLFDLVVVSSDLFAISQRQAVEGFGTGIVDHVETDTTLLSQSAAFESAASLLNKYATEARSLSWDTEREGLDAGQLITANLPDLDFDGVQLYIFEVTTKDKASRLIHSVRAAEGPDDKDWASWFKKIAQPAEPLFFRENIGEEETVIVLTSYAENWEWTEDVAQTVYSCPVPSTSLFPSTTLFPC